MKRAILVALGIVGLFGCWQATHAQGSAYLIYETGTRNGMVPRLGPFHTLQGCTFVSLQLSSTSVGRFECFTIPND